MRRQIFFLIALLALLAATLPSRNAIRAQEREGRLDQSLRIERLQLNGVTSLTSGLGQLTATATGGPVKVVIELHDQPAAQVFAEAQTRMSAAQATIQAQQQLGRIQAMQQVVLTSLQAPAIDARVLYRTQRVLNAIAVQVSPDKLDQIHSLPGVQAIYPLVPKQLSTSTSVPLIGAPHVWSDSRVPATGKGLEIGIIDTGIDYTHADFGGPGTVEAYQDNDPTTIDDNDLFPNAKVVGGYDFVGDDYNASDPANDIPQPDPDPIDCNGHGTHVAGIAAGFGVESDGSTYTGPYGPDTPFDDLRIGPGVAPEANLYALKVFGCAGSTDVTELAIEWAVDPNGDGDFSDRLDVLNMSLGSQYGSAYDPTAIASNNAAAAGVVVVASAGNSGDTYYVTGSPATATRAISVASSLDEGIVFIGISVNAPEAIAGTYEAAAAVFGPGLPEEPLTDDVVYVEPPLACTPLTNADQINGQIALIDRGGCTFVTKVKNAQDAGAVAVILVNNVAGAPIPPGGQDPEITIPTVMISQADGQLIKDQLAAGNTVNVTLSADITIERPDLVDTLSDFSSRGPRRGDSLLKPDLTAPGQQITSALVSSGAEPVAISGTSMAAPHVAGMMALLRQIHPDWSVEELKALAMNTATHDLRSEADEDSAVYGPARIGAGRVDAVNAASSHVIAYNANDVGVVSVSFGSPEVVGKATATKTIRVLNKTGERQSYKVRYDSRVDMPGVQYNLSASSVTLPPYGFADIVVTMTAESDKMKHTRDDTVSDEQTAPSLEALPRYWLSEEAGLVVLTSKHGPNLRVPIYATPRPASVMRAESKEITFDDDAKATIDLVGQGVLTGRNFPLDYVSIVTAFELQHSSPNDVRSQFIFNNSDLKYVGVASDFPATEAISDTVISFGIATHGNWSTPSETRFNIFIDTDQDGTPDFRLLNTNTGLLTGGDATDTFVTVLVNLESGEVIPQSFLNGVPASVVYTVPFNNNVMLLPVFATDLGLTDEDAAFNYEVVTESLYYELEDEDLIIYDLIAVDSTPVLTYNAAAPGLNLFAGEPGIPAYFDLDGNSIPVTYNRDAFAANKSQGILLLHHYNATLDRRPEVIRIVDAE